MNFFEGANQFDPHATVPRDILLDLTAPSLGAPDSDDPNLGSSKSPTHSNPSGIDEDEHVVPAAGSFLTYEVGNDYNQDIEPLPVEPTDQSDILSSLIWDILQQGPDQIYKNGPDEVVGELPEELMDFGAVVMEDDQDEQSMQVDVNEEEGAAWDPQGLPAVNFQQFPGEMEGNYFYFPQ